LARGNSVQILLHVFARDFIRRGRSTGHRIAITKPARQIAVAATCGAEWRVIFAPWFLANGAGLGFGGRSHNGTACANPPSMARPGSAVIRTSRPVRRDNSSSHSGFNLAFRAG